MSTNRRKYTPRQTRLIPCEICIELKYTPTYLEALLFVRNFKTTIEGTDWYHLNGHAVFVE